MNPAKYSFTWAMDRVQELRGKYARATDSVEEFLGITDRNLAALLATGDAIWPLLRDLIHEADKWDITNPGIRCTTHLLSRIRLYWPREMIDRALEGLDKKRKRMRMEEQGSKGAVVRSVSDEQQLPLFLDLE